MINKDIKNLIDFATKHKNKWHSYNSDAKTSIAIRDAKKMGFIETNEFQQFRFKRGL